MLVLEYTCTYTHLQVHKSVPPPQLPLLHRVKAAKEEVMVLDKRIGFLGAGQMAEALARGFLSKGVVTNISVSDPSPERKELFRGFGCTPRSSNDEVGWCLLTFFVYCVHRHLPCRCDESEATPSSAASDHLGLYPLCRSWPTQTSSS